MERVQIRTTNFVISIAALTSLLWVVGGVASEMPSVLVLINSVAVFLYCGCILLHSKQQYDVVRFGLVVIAGCQYVVLIWMVGLGNGVEILTVLFVAVPILLFNGRQKTRMVAAYALVAVIVGAGLVTPWIPNPPELVMSKLVYQIGYAGNIVTTTVVMAGALFYYINLSLLKDQQVQNLLSSDTPRVRHLLPQPIIDRTSSKTASTRSMEAEAGVLIVQIDGLGQGETALAPVHRVQLLEAVFSRLDEIAEKHKVERLKTFGTLYLASTGVHRPGEINMTGLADAALEMKNVVQRFAEFHGHELRVRLGICSGRVVASAAGDSLPPHQYLWGETDTIAAHLDISDEFHRVQVSESARGFLDRDFTFSEGVQISRPEGPPMMTYFLLSRRSRS